MEPIVVQQNGTRLRVRRMVFRDSFLADVVAGIDGLFVRRLVLGACGLNDEGWAAIARAFGKCGIRTCLSLEEQEMPGTRGLLALADAARANPLFTIILDRVELRGDDSEGIVALVGAFAERGNTRAECGCEYDDSAGLDCPRVWCGKGISLLSFHASPGVFAAVMAEVVRARTKRAFVNLLRRDDDFATDAAAVAAMIRESRALDSLVVMPHLEGRGSTPASEAAMRTIADAVAVAPLPINIDMGYEHADIARSAMLRGDANRAIASLLLAPSPGGRDTPASRFLRRDGDNACAHRGLRFLVE